MLTESIRFLIYEEGRDYDKLKIMEMGNCR